MRRQGIILGLPLVCHLGIWADVIALSPLLILIVSISYSEWSLFISGVVFLLALAGSFLIHQFVYRKGGIEEAHVRWQKVTRAGWYHCIYMAFASGILFLFYFYSAEQHLSLLRGTTIYLAVHLFFGTHIALGLFKPYWFPKRPIKELGTWIPILLVVLPAAFVYIGKLYHWF